MSATPGAGRCSISATRWGMIEAQTGYARYRHGEAVGLGLLAALRLSGADALRDEVEGVLAHMDCPSRSTPKSRQMG